MDPELARERRATEVAADQVDEERAPCRGGANKAPRHQADADGGEQATEIAPVSAAERDREGGAAAKSASGRSLGCQRGASRARAAGHARVASQTIGSVRQSVL